MNGSRLYKYTSALENPCFGLVAPGARSGQPAGVGHRGDRVHAEELPASDHGLPGGRRVQGGPRLPAGLLAD